MPRFKKGQIVVYNRRDGTEEADWVESSQCNYPEERAYQLRGKKDGFLVESSRLRILTAAERGSCRRSTFYSTRKIVERLIPVLRRFASSLTDEYGVPCEPTGELFFSKCCGLVATIRQELQRKS